MIRGSQDLRKVGMPGEVCADTQDKPAVKQAWALTTELCCKWECKLGRGVTRGRGWGKTGGDGTQRGNGRQEIETDRLGVLCNSALPHPPRSPHPWPTCCMSSVPFLWSGL